MANNLLPGSAKVCPQPARPSVPSPPDSPDYDGVLPQRKPKKAKLAKAVAAGYFDVYGSQVSCSCLWTQLSFATVPDVLGWLVQARAEVQLLSSRAIRLLDVQGLLLWVLADGMNPSWCFVKVCDSPAVCSCKLITHPGQEFAVYCCVHCSLQWSRPLHCKELLIGLLTPPYTDSLPV